MKKMKNLFALGLAVLLTGLAAQAAFAQGTDTRNINVSATVNASCNITAPAGGAAITMAFGIVDVIAAGGVNSQPTFTLQCNKGAAPVVSLNNGLNASGTQKRMTDGTDFLSYSILVPSGVTTVSSGTCPATIAAGTEWNATGTLSVSGLYSASGGAHPIILCGRVETPQASVGAGSYADTVLLTVTF